MQHARLRVATDWQRSDPEMYLSRQMRHLWLSGAPLVAAAVFIGAATISGDAASPASSIRIEKAWARPGVAAPAGVHGKGTEMGPGASAIYMVIHNTGSQADRLLRADAGVAAAVELHETRMEGGMSRMHKVPAIVVPARGRAQLRPGGLHIMLLGLKRDLKEGERLAVTLHFERAGAVAISVPVRMSAP
ncbi:MAG: copper chaperone PCu(A)C [Armatimonadota bacterium]|nr:copper chaperone PCu(A)C [Armatimonadota bacterium]